MNLTNKKIIGVVALGVIIILSLTTSGVFNNDSSALIYKTAKVDRNDIISHIAATGTLSPTITMEINAHATGTISNIYVDYNSHVKKNDPLAEIDTISLKTELKRARADHRKSKAELNIASSVLKANQELYNKRLISKEELDDSKGKYSSSLAALEQSEVVLEIAKANLDNSVIRSPIDGFVLSKNVNLGERVITNSKTLFLIVGDMATMKVNAKVNESDIGKVEKGQKAFFTVDAYPNQTFESAISQIMNEPIVNDNVVGYEVTALANNENFKLKSGMTAEVRIVVANKQAVLRVPTASIRFIPPPSANVKDKLKDTSSWVVWIPSGNEQISAIPVKIGVSDDRHTEIIEGNIKEGQEVIVEALSKNNPSNDSSYLPQPRRF